MTKQHQNPGQVEANQWLPLSARHEPNRARVFERLYDDVPEWLRDPLLDWIASNVDTDGFLSEIMFSPQLKLQMQLALRKKVPYFLSELSTSDYLDVIDYLLANSHIPSDSIRHLDRLLLDGGSAFKATPEGLFQRLDDSLQRVADSVVEQDSRPSEYLRKSHRKAWGRNPDASGAHQDAVSAVEAAYAPIVSPRNERATLGTIIGNMRDGHAKFRLRLESQSRIPGEDVLRVVAMMELLWKSQIRHGTADTDAQTEVSIEQARDAVVLAIALVHLVQGDGLILDGN